MKREGQRGLRCKVEREKAKRKTQKTKVKSEELGGNSLRSKVEGKNSEEGGAKRFKI